MVVARVGVAALAVAQAIADGVVVVALDALNVVFVQEGKDPVRVRTEGTQVAQAEARLRAAAAGVADGVFQCEVIAVDAAEDGDPAVFRHRDARPRSWNRWPRAGNRCSRLGVEEHTP